MAEKTISEYVENVREILDAKTAGDAGRIVDLLSDDLQWYGVGLDGSQALVGKEGFLHTASEIGNRTDNIKRTWDFRGVGRNLVIATLHSQLTAGDLSGDGYAVIVVSFDGDQVTSAVEIADAPLVEYLKKLNAQATA